MTLAEQLHQSATHGESDPNCPVCTKLASDSPASRADATDKPEPENLNGMRVIARTNEAIYLRIPETLQHQSGWPGCTCGSCDGRGMWDTLVVPIRQKPEYPHDFGYTVHMPDKAIAGFLDYMKRKDAENERILKLRNAPRY